MKKLLLASFLLTSCGTEEVSYFDIVGGQPAPYKAFYAKAGGCGASLIGKERRWLISAKHCGDPQKATIGLWKKGPGNGGKFKEEIRITKVVKHPKWDLQLLKLARPSKARPITLSTHSIEDGARLAAFGFGNTSYGGSGPDQLKGAVFYYNERATNGARPGIIRASNRPNAAVCHGDSGGPLVYNGRLLATITFTEGKCSKNGLMGFTRIDFDWVKDVID